MAIGGGGEERVIRYLRTCSGRSTAAWASREASISISTIAATPAQASGGTSTP